MADESVLAELLAVDWAVGGEIGDDEGQLQTPLVTEARVSEQLEEDVQQVVADNERCDRVTGGEVADYPEQLTLGRDGSESKT